MPSRAIQQTESGFTLIEVLVALFLLAGVALLLADLTCRAARITDRARRQVVMTMMAVERVEQLKGLSWGLGDAEAPVPVSDFGTDLSGVAPGPGGDGLSVSPIDSLAVNERGYVDFADRRGDWLGSGPTVPPGAAFVRRWRVSFVPSAPNCLALDVFVDIVDPSAPRPTAPTATAVRLTTVKVRKAA